jgi:hypothetical protein
MIVCFQKSALICELHVQIQEFLSFGLRDSFINCWTLEGYVFLNDLNLHDVGSFSNNNP